MTEYTTEPPHILAALTITKRGFIKKLWRISHGKRSNPHLSDCWRKSSSAKLRSKTSWRNAASTAIPSIITEEIIREESDAVIKKYSSVNSIVECFDAIEEFASNRKRAILHIYRSVNRDVFERYLMKTGEYFLSRYIDALAAEGEIDQFLISRNKSLIVGYYKCLFFGVIIEWLESGMDEQLAKDFRRIFRLKADTADGLAEILRSQI